MASAPGLSAAGATIRISDLIDSYRDLLTGAMDVYLSTVSNQLNSVMSN